MQMHAACISTRPENFVWDFLFSVRGRAGARARGLQVGLGLFGSGSGSTRVNNFFSIGFGRDGTFFSVGIGS